MSNYFSLNKSTNASENTCPFEHDGVQNLKGGAEGAMRSEAATRQVRALGHSRRMAVEL